MSHFYFDYKKFWVVGNAKPVIDRLDQNLFLLLISVHFTQNYHLLLFSYYLI